MDRLLVRIVRCLRCQRYPDRGPAPFHAAVHAAVARDGAASFESENARVRFWLGFCEIGSRDVRFPGKASCDASAIAGEPRGRDHFPRCHLPAT